MSQQFVGIPLGKNKAIFFDVVLVICTTMIFIFIGIAYDNMWAVLLSLLSGFALLISPIHMSSMCHTALILIFEDDTV